MRTALRVIVALGTVLALVLPAAATVAAAGISIAPSSGAIGTGATVSGSGFSAMTTVSVLFDGSDGTLIGAESTDASGNFNSLPVTIPNVTGGTYEIFASDGTNTATTSFTVPSSLTLTPASGTPGTSVSVSGTGFLSGEGVVVGWNRAGRQVATGTANGNGAFTATFNVPNSGNGDHTVFATGHSSGFQLTATFAVNGSSAADLSLSPTSGPAGSDVTLTGSGFGANEQVNLAVDGGVVMSVTTNGNGNFTAMITLSSSLAVGEHTITATGVSSGHSASATFAVTTRQQTQCNGDDARPGNGFGDRNHCHTGHEDRDENGDNGGGHGHGHHHGNQDSDDEGGDD